MDQEAVEGQRWFRGGCIKKIMWIDSVLDGFKKEKKKRKREWVNLTCLERKWAGKDQLQQNNVPPTG